MSPSSLRNVRLLALFNFFTDFRLYGPVLIIYFADVAGSYALATSVLSITMLSSALLELPTGVLSDKFGRARVALGGAIAGTVAVSCYAIATEYWLLVLGGVSEGLARALFSGNNQALLYDTLAEHDKTGEYHRHAGRVGSMFQLALAVSAVVGGVIAHWSLRTTVILSVIPQMICVGVALAFREPKVHGPIDSNPFAHIAQAVRNFRANRQLRRVVVAGAVSYGAGESAFQMQPAFINALWPTWALGLARMGNNALAFTSFRFAGRIIDRFGATKTLLIGQVWANVANLVAVVNPTVASPAIIASESLAYGSSSVAQDALQQADFTDTERATMGSLGSLLGSVVFGTIAIAAGVLADHYGLRTTLLLCQAIGLATLPAFWIVHLHAKRGHSGHPA